MRVALALTVALFARGSCRADKPKVDARPEVAPSASAPLETPSSEPPKPEGCRFAVDEARALSLLREKAEVRLQLKGPKRRLFVVAAPRCEDRDAGEPTYTIAIGDEGDPPASLWPGFKVGAETGEVQAKSLCQSLDYLPYKTWAREESLTNLVWDLPEVRGFGRSLRQASAGKVWPLIRLERCPTPSEPDEDYFYYVGERHDDHSVRWKSFSVASKSGAVSVYGFDAIRTPYADWAATQEAKHYAATGFPPADKGGSLGYGAPEKTVTDVAAWKHPTKKIVQELGPLDKVETYASTYPVFVVRSPEAPTLALAERVLAANGYWPFEIVVEPGHARFRHTGEAWEMLDGAAWVKLAKSKR